MSSIGHLCEQLERAGLTATADQPATDDQPRVDLGPVRAVLAADPLPTGWQDYVASLHTALADDLVARRLDPEQLVDRLVALNGATSPELPKVLTEARRRRHNDALAVLAAQADDLVAALGWRAGQLQERAQNAVSRLFDAGVRPDNPNPVIAAAAAGPAAIAAYGELSLARSDATALDQLRQDLERAGALTPGQAPPVRLDLRRPTERPDATHLGARAERMAGIA